jgi:ethanolamine ammonia-lyase large subunit
VFIATGFGSSPGELRPELQTEVTRIYTDAKKSIWSELSAEFVNQVPDQVELATRSKDRTDYILHPESGEHLNAASLKAVQNLKGEYQAEFDTQIVISDGLNSLSISDDGHLLPFLDRLRSGLAGEGFYTAPRNVVLRSGRVRAGYRIGETLFGGLPGSRSIIHIIGERPGSGHHTFSAYITRAGGDVWERSGVVDHNITRVVSGVARTAYRPESAADEVVRILKSLRGGNRD